MSAALYARAVQLATLAHGGQTDRGGRPYIAHLLSVADGVSTYEEKIAAIFHDILEDTNVTKEDLLKDGYPLESISAVAVLTHDPEDSRGEYMAGVRRNRIARAVKLADLRDNMDITRLRKLTDLDIARLRQYHSDYLFLMD